MRRSSWSAFRDAVSAATPEPEARLRVSFRDLVAAQLEMERAVVPPTIGGTDLPSGTTPDPNGSASRTAPAPPVAPPAAPPPPGHFVPVIRSTRSTT